MIEDPILSELDRSIAILEAQIADSDAGPWAPEHVIVKCPEDEAKVREMQARFPGKNIVIREIVSSALRFEPVEECVQPGMCTPHLAAPRAPRRHGSPDLRYGGNRPGTDAGREQWRDSTAREPESSTRLPSDCVTNLSVATPLRRVGRPRPSGLC
jgi:hypothetical protein